METTKHKILDVSRRLFNDLGYSQVTIRMIAIELKMSSGNLNYHFRKREDILEALYFEMVEIFDKRIEVLEDQSITLEFMQSNIRTSMEKMIEYRFFWTDLYNLIKSNVKIKEHFEAARYLRVGGYQYLFNDFISRGILQKPTFSNEYDMLIERMIDYGNTWLYASALNENQDKSDQLIRRSSFQLLSMLFPYLRKSSRITFQNIHPVFFDQG